MKKKPCPTRQMKGKCPNYRGNSLPCIACLDRKAFVKSCFPAIEIEGLEGWDFNIER